MKDYVTSPDGFEMLDTERMGKESLSLCSYGNLQSAGTDDRPSVGWLGHARPYWWTWWGISGIWWCGTLQWVEVVGQSVNELSGGELFEESHGQQLSHKCPCLADSNVARVELSLLAEL